MHHYGATCLIHIETHEKGTGDPETVAKSKGAMREVAIDQDFAAEKDKLPLDFSDRRSNPEDCTRHQNYNKSSAGQRLARAGARLVSGLRLRGI